MKSQALESNGRCFESGATSWLKSRNQGFERGFSTRETGGGLFVLGLGKGQKAQTALLCCVL
jgi:hypothetical protein